jgi:hypothetical protein
MLQRCLKILEDQDLLPKLHVGVRDVDEATQQGRVATFIRRTASNRQESSLIRGKSVGKAEQPLHW